MIRLVLCCRNQMKRYSRCFVFWKKNLKSFINHLDGNFTNMIFFFIKTLYFLIHQFGYVISLPVLD